MKVNIYSDNPYFKYQFNVEDSGIIGIYGISGSGKTSLLRGIAGFNQQVKGSIIIGNKTIFNSENNPLVPVQKCSYMSQQSILFPHWTVMENLKFAESHSIVDRQETESIISQLQCSKLLNKLPSQLSGGEKQRVSFIRALISSRSTHLILLDEPFSALDEENKEHAFKLLNHYKQNNIILLVTHDISELYRYADELLYIKNGCIHYQDNINSAMTSGQHQLPIASKITVDGQQQIIYADDVSVSLNDLTDSSIVHQIPVAIEQINRQGSCTVLMLKTSDNHILFAKITTQSLDKLQLTLNKKVMANFKATAYR